MSENAEKEIWKDIKGYEGLYQVSNLGRVRSLRKQFLKKVNFVKKVEKYYYLKLQNTHKGYLSVRLYKNKVYKQMSVHRIVALTFLKNLNNKPTVNHLNEIKTDNRVENLEWATYIEQSRHNDLHIRLGLRTRNNNLSKPINKIKEGKIIKRYPSINEAMRDGYISSNICSCLKGKRKKHKGFNWEYA